VRGEPDPQELAALITVLAARGAAAAEAAGNTVPAARRSGWTDRSRYVRQRIPHAPGAWRASALPR
jgi:hypothetical protein